MLLYLVEIANADCGGLARLIWAHGTVQALHLYLKEMEAANMLIGEEEDIRAHAVDINPPSAPGVISLPPAG